MTTFDYFFLTFWFVFVPMQCWMYDAWSPYSDSTARNGWPTPF